MVRVQDLRLGGLELGVTTPQKQNMRPRRSVLLFFTLPTARYDLNIQKILRKSEIRPNLNPKPSLKACSTQTANGCEIG